MKKNDIILIAIIMLFALIGFGGVSLYFSGSMKDAEAVVYLDGKEYGRYPLKQEKVIEIKQENGDYNLIQIGNGKADIIDASCPDRICVKHRSISKRGESIVCLPNKIVVEIKNGVESEVDGSTN
ncbi:MAG: NusG domain II-containing protein [Lachnospiraceae bacterium]